MNRRTGPGSKDRLRPQRDTSTPASIENRRRPAAIQIKQRKQHGGEVIELHAFDDPRAQSDALAKAVGGALHASLAARASATRARPTTFAVSGGTSPRPFLQTLTAQLFDWKRIAVTLVDDRWVPDTDDASNARLARETLLRNAASEAAFLPLVDAAQSLDAHIGAL